MKLLKILDIITSKIVRLETSEGLWDFHVIIRTLHYQLEFRLEIISITTCNNLICLLIQWLINALIITGYLLDLWNLWLVIYSNLKLVTDLNLWVLPDLLYIKPPDIFKYWVGYLNVYTYGVFQSSISIKSRDTITNNNTLQGENNTLKGKNKSGRHEGYVVI